MDERTNVLSRALLDRMQREAELFDRLGLEVERLRESFQEKSWSAGLVIAQGMENAAEEIAAADAARDQAFVLLRSALDLPRETSFSGLMPALPDEARGELEDGWRRLRVAVIRLKTATGRMRYSAEALADALNRILEQIFPYRKGKIYSRRGTPTGVSGAVLVDRKQ
jgi:hypothetical protein